MKTAGREKRPAVLFFLLLAEMTDKRLEIEELRIEAKTLMEKDFDYYAQNLGLGSIPCQILQLWFTAIQREPVDANEINRVSRFINENPYWGSIQFESFKATVQAFSNQLWNDQLKRR